MKLVNEFTVAAPIEQTWTTLLDVERVASCLPGASIEPVGEDGSYRGRMRVKVGPVSMSYGGTVRLAEVDADSHVAAFEARAKETRGTGTAAATIRNTLTETAEGTRVQVETDLDVTGRPAQFGRGLMEEVASKMLGQFSGRLEKLVLDGPPADSSPADASAGSGAKAAADADGGAAPRAASSAPSSDDDEVLDLGAAMLGGGATKLVAGGLGIGLLVALLSLVFKRRSRRGLSFSISYRS
ncbi:MAG TPA: SRPBCC family protein [Solirubrobacterales bacterium]|jgi:carbon monoxide dehydrogenase subunit G